jgi:multicomponent Na+:H+ antiporter subunit E
MIVVFYVLGVVVMWVLAWGTLSLANVLSGLAVAAVLVVVVPDDWTHRRRMPFRPIAVAKLAAFIVGQVVTSNWLLARSVVARQSKLHTGVMAVALPESSSDEVLTLISNVIALTPGTTPIQLTRHPTVLYIHVLDMRDVETARRDVQRLARLAYLAFDPGHVDHATAERTP